MLFYTSTKAQNKPFSKRLNTKENIESGQQIEVVNNNKIFIYSSNSYTINNEKKLGSTLYLTELNGIEIKNKVYTDLSSLKLNTECVITKDKVYYFSLKNYSDPLLEQKLVIMELNHNLDSLNSFSFDPVGVQYPSSIAQYSENELILLVVDASLINSYLYLYDIKKREIKWTKKILDETIYKCSSPSKLIVDNDKNILILSRVTKKGEDFNDYNRPLLTKFDGKGQKIFAKSYPEVTFVENLNEIVQMDSTSYLFACRASENVPGHGGDTIVSPPTFFALNKDGSIKWKKYFYATYSDGYSVMRGFTLAKNGDIIGFGYKDDKKKKPKLSGWMFRLTKDGKQKWSRIIRDEIGLSTAKAIIAGDLYDVKEGPYGMLYGTGLYIDTFPNYEPSINNNNVWLIGVDSMGCFTPNCSGNQVWTAVDDNATLVTSEQPYKIYPNPAQDVLKVLSLQGFENSERITYEIYNLQGQLVAKGKPDSQADVLDINIAPFISGSYLLKIQSPRGIKSFVFYKT